MSLTEIIEWIRQHYIITLIIVFILVRAVYATIRNRQIKTEGYKVATLILQWWQAPEEQGGYGQKPMEHKNVSKRNDSSMISDVQRNCLNYVKKHLDTVSTSDAIAISNKYGRYNIFAIEGDPYSIVLLGGSSTPWLLFRSYFMLKINLTGNASDLKIKLKQTFIHIQPSYKELHTNIKERY